MSPAAQSSEPLRSPLIPILIYNAGVARAPTTADAFNAVAEPRRRQIIDLLAAGERSVTTLVRELDLAQPHVSRHLRVLREVGAVAVRDHGRQRLYRLNVTALKPIHDWVSRFEDQWSDRFDALDVVLDQLKDEFKDELKKEEHSDANDEQTSERQPPK